MDTQTIDTTHKGKGRPSAAQAATASGVAGAAAGAAATFAFDAYGRPAESTPPAAADPGEPAEPTQPSAADPGASAEPTPPSATGPSAPTEPTQPDPAGSGAPTGPADPAPHTATHAATQASAQEPSEPVEPVEPVATDDVPYTDLTAQQPAQPGPDDAPDPATDAAGPATAGPGPDGPDEGDIIAIVEIDPQDIDMADIMEFDEIGLIYTEDGDVFTMASFHDAYGDEYYLVDIDGDLYFDLLIDETMTQAEVDSLISVTDAEAQLTDHLAHLEADDVTSAAISDLDVADDILA